MSLCQYVSGSFSTETQSHHFGGNNYLSIKGVALEYYKKYYTGKFLTGNTVDLIIGEFRSYLYDNIKQYKSTTAAYIIDILNILVTNNVIIQNVSKI